MKAGDQRLLGDRHRRTSNPGGGHVDLELADGLGPSHAVAAIDQDLVSTRC
jgi:hypothetical protein